MVVPSVDAEDDAPRRAREEAARAAGVKLHIISGAVDHLPLFSESADAVLLAGQLCRARDPAAALREAARVLRPGGRCFLCEHVAAPRADAPALRVQQRLLSTFNKARAGTDACLWRCVRRC